MTVLPLTPDGLLTTTRSVRKRLDLTRPVPMDLITECLQIALQSPSGGNPQGWHWLVITDRRRGPPSASCTVVRPSANWPPVAAP